MTDKKKLFIYGRGRKEFIAAKPDEDGSISWSVDYCPNRSYGDTVESYIKIRDCTRTVTLEFSIYENDSYEDRLLKVDNLIDSLQAFRGALAATEALLTLTAPFKKKEKKEDHKDASSD